MSLHSCAAQGKMEMVIGFLEVKKEKIDQNFPSQAFLILSSTEHILRVEYLNEILRVYHDTFTTTFSKLVSEAPKVTFEELVADYYRVGQLREYNFYSKSERWNRHC